MESSNQRWKKQTQSFNPELHDALLQQHHAAQFIALVGRHLIPKQADDSNTNMEFMPDEGLMIGNVMPNGMRIALNLSTLKISILDEKNEARKVIVLEGKTKQNLFEELKQSLSALGVDVSKFINELHYEIPAHKLDSGGVFEISKPSNFIENANFRSNAKLILNEIGQLFEQKEEIRIWPHHFDTGAFFTIAKNKKGEATQTIGIGWAIPDGMINEPYYYLSFWSQNPADKLDKLKALNAGNWLMPSWDGAVLKHSEILKIADGNDQFELVKSFFNSGINILRGFLK